MENAAAMPKRENHADSAPSRMSNGDPLNFDTLDGSYANAETTGDNREDSFGKPSLASDLAVDGATSNGNTILVTTTDYDEDSTQAKHNSKLSLLGHGPHGKQVVDHLLKEYGEDGIREFCQRWRQVFVDALKPRFLPAGWDVKHRYAIK